MNISPQNLEDFLNEVVLLAAKASQDEDDDITKIAQSIAASLGQSIPAISILDIYSHFLQEVKPDNPAPSEKDRVLVFPENLAPEVKVPKTLCGILSILPSIMKCVCRSDRVKVIPGLLKLLSGSVSLEESFHRDEYYCILIETADDLVSSIHSECIGRLDIVSTMIIIIYKTLGYSKNTHVVKRATEVITKVTSLAGANTTEEFYNEFFDEIMELVRFHCREAECARKWEKHSFQLVLFDVVVRGCGDTIYSHLAEIVPYFQVLLDPENQPDVLISVLALLDTVVRTKWDVESFRAYGKIIICQLLLPNCTWRVGRVSSTIRKISISCLESLMSNQFITAACIEENLEIFISTTVSCLSDDDSITRKMTCSVLRSLFELYSGDLNEQSAFDIYADLLKRLDDSDDHVRICICGTLCSFFRASNPSFWAGTPLNYTLDCLFVHLDDQDIRVQKSVFNCLRSASYINPSMFIQLTSRRIQHHHNPVNLELLLAHAESLFHNAEKSGSGKKENANTEI